MCFKNMKHNRSQIFYKRIVSLYEYSCVALAIVLVLGVFYAFFQNSDITRVEWVEFQSTEERIYPSFSLCIGDILRNDKLKEYGVDKNEYLRFLTGEIWDPRLIGIDYHNVSVNLLEDLLAFEMYEEKFNGDIVSDRNYLFDRTGPSKAHMVPSFYQDSSPAFGLIQKCLTFDIPYEKDKRWSWITVVMNKSIFVSGARPFNSKMNNKDATDVFSVHIHHPGQRYRYSQTKRDWNTLEPSKDHNHGKTSYGMKFYISSVEIMKKRNKYRKPCHNDENLKDDEIIKENMINNFACNPPYWTNQESRIPSNCSTQKQIKDFQELSIKDFVTPCRRMSQLTYLYSEYPSEYYYNKLQNLPSKDQFFYITLFYPFSLDYKEITMLRELNVQSLIGNAGGYVGICVGYSILHIPNLITAIHRKIMNIFFFNKKNYQLDTM